MGLPITRLLPTQPHLAALTGRHEQIPVHGFQKCFLLLFSQFAENQQERIDFHFIELVHVPGLTLVAMARLQAYPWELQAPSDQAQFERRE